MTIQEYINHIKLRLGSPILKLELTDEDLEKIVLDCFNEVQRYIDVPKFVTVPFSKVIDLTDFKSSAITHVYRAENSFDINKTLSGSMLDPIQGQMLATFSNGFGANMYNLNQYLLNYMSYSTLQQIRNTMSTELDWVEDKLDKKLYINNTLAIDKVTISYIPIYEKVEEIVDDYWQDILRRLSVATTKVILGRARTRFKVSNALYTDDGDTMLQEGTTELSELRTRLTENDDLFMVVD